jgi:hypothetical protein
MEYGILMALAMGGLLYYLRSKKAKDYKNRLNESLIDLDITDVTNPNWVEVDYEDA